MTSIRNKNVINRFHKRGFALPTASRSRFGIHASKSNFDYFSDYILSTQSNILKVSMRILLEHLAYILVPTQVLIPIKMHPRHPMLSSLFALFILQDAAALDGSGKKFVLDEWARDPLNRNAGECPSFPLPLTDELTGVDVRRIWPDCCSRRWPSPGESSCKRLNHPGCTDSCQGTVHEL
jgi:hypothetical protein